MKNKYEVPKLHVQYVRMDEAIAAGSANEFYREYELEDKVDIKYLDYDTYESKDNNVYF